MKYAPDLSIDQDKRKEVPFQGMYTLADGCQRCVVIAWSTDKGNRRELLLAEKRMVRVE